MAKGAYIFAGSAAAAAAGWRGPLLAVGANGVLLLGVRVEGRVAEVGLVAVLAAVVPAVMVVLAAAAPSHLLEFLLASGVAFLRLGAGGRLVSLARELCLVGGLGLLQRSRGRRQDRRVFATGTGRALLDLVGLGHGKLVVLASNTVCEKGVEAVLLTCEVAGAGRRGRCLGPPGAGSCQWCSRCCCWAACVLECFIIIVWLAE